MSFLCNHKYTHPVTRLCVHGTSLESELVVTTKSGWFPAVSIVNQNSEHVVGCNAVALYNFHLGCHQMVENN